VPLPADMGQAIASCLHPRAAGQRLAGGVLAGQGSYRPNAPGTVSSAVRRACKRAGIPDVGAHRLRHAVACEMVSARVPLQRIGLVLRHRSLHSTAIYARVDLDQLRLLAAPWPGGYAFWPSSPVARGAQRGPRQHARVVVHSREIRDGRKLAARSGLA
jgi:integrase/recombinase XerD